MLSTRWIKLVRDIQMTPWCIALMLLAIAVGVFSFTTMLSSYTLLSREVSRNYLATNPASASLSIDSIDTKLLADIRRFPGIAQAQASATIGVDLYFPDGSLHPLTIFVLEDFNQLKINTIFAEAGAWPPSPNTVLLERSSLAQANVSIGDSVKIRLKGGVVRSLDVSGSVHDPAVPVPSMSMFAYASPDTLKSLGVDSPLTELKITVSDRTLDAAAIEQTASQLALWMQQQKHKVSRIRIPPPGEHPHQRFIFSVTAVLLLFSGIALLLSAILTATIVDGLMAQQVRQIGIMKTLGASAAQIAGLYFTFVLILSVLATSLGIFVGLQAGRALAKMILTNLNFDLQNSTLPPLIYLLLLSAGILPPLLMAAVPIIKSTRRSVQSSLINVGTSHQYYVLAKCSFFPMQWWHFQSWHWLSQYLGSVLHRLPGLDRSLLMALRNSFRRKGRLLLILTLLTSAGAMFMSGLNLQNASQQHLIAAAAERHYDLEMSLSSAEDREKISAILQSVTGVKVVEAWSSATLARQRPDGLNVEQTYADGGHGALHVTVIPKDSHLLSIKMLRGNWLSASAPNNDDTVVLNRKALESFAKADIGDDITIGVAGNARTLHLVGIAAQKMTGGMAYVSAATYQKLTGQDEHYSNYRIVTEEHDDVFVAIVTKKIEAMLAQQHIKINSILTESRLRHEVDGHFTLLINALLFTSILMAVVGISGLGIVMATHVSERIGEFGIMRSLGASSRIIIRNIIVEALFISFMSWILAIAVSLPLSLTVSDFLGKLLFDEAFPLAPSLTAIWAWLLILVCGATLASLYPAKKATHVTIRESFSY